MCEQYGRDALDIVAVYDNVDIADIILKRRLPDGNDVETVLFVSLSILCMLCCLFCVFQTVSMSMEDAAVEVCVCQLCVERTKEV